MVTVTAAPRIANSPCQNSFEKCPLFNSRENVPLVACFLASFAPAGGVGRGEAGAERRPTGIPRLHERESQVLDPAMIVTPARDFRLIVNVSMFAGL
jgi:hypothetical protein